MKKLLCFSFLLLLLAGCRKYDFEGIVHPNPVRPIYSSTIYLKFQGGTVTGTSWNTTDSLWLAPSGLNPEQEALVVQSVAEAYDTFQVTVTTDSLLYANAPATRRQTCYITATWSWYGKAGGTSYTGSFVWGDNTPCFVFSSLLNFNSTDIGEAVSHEIGHTLGLRHQAQWDSTGTKISDYNPGNSEMAPIMGKPYAAKKAIWWVGLNPYGQVQDDVALLHQLLQFR